MKEQILMLYIFKQYKTNVIISFQTECHIKEAQYRVDISGHNIIFNIALIRSCLQNINPNIRDSSQY